MDIKRRALYNSLRMNWLRDNTIPVEKWQVEDYRAIETSKLFEALKKLGASLDEVSFAALSDSVDSPEEMTEALCQDMDLSVREKDRIYLHVFELWRRLVAEKPSLSVFCDELDQQIFLYDQEIDNFEGLQDAVANLQMILEENIDQGAKPAEIFEMIKTRCAHDLDTFLYDFISDEIDNGNELYASELIDGFDACLEGNKWFDLVKARLFVREDPEAAGEMIKKLIHKAIKQEDIEYNLEILSFIVQEADKSDFVKLVKITLPLVETEEDFLELLSVCGDYFLLLDEDEKEKSIQNIIKRHSQNAPEKKLSQDHPDTKELLSILS